MDLSLGLIGGRRGYPLTFGSYAAVPIDTVIMSRTIQVRTAGTIVITAGIGEYQINGGLWVSIPGTVEVGDKVRVRLTSSVNYSTETVLEITIDGIADTFSVTTVAEDTVIFGPTWAEPDTWDDNKIWSEA